MITTIYLVRHAHSVYTADERGRPLSSCGLEDASRVTQILSQVKIDSVISSPYKRAVETVEGISKNKRTDIIIKEGFKERELSSNPVKDFESAITKVWQDESFAWEGGESNIAAQKRGVTALLELLEKDKGKNIAVGTHGNIMVLIMNYFDKSYDFSFWKGLDMPDIYKLRFDGLVLMDVTRVWSR